MLKLFVALFPLAIPILFFLGPRVWKGLAAGFVAGLLLMFPGAFLNPLAEPVIQSVACEPGSKLETKASGRGGGHFCVAKNGQTERVFLWSAVTSFDLHFILIGAPATAFFFVRDRKAAAARLAV